MVVGVVGGMHNPQTLKRTYTREDVALGAAAAAGDSPKPAARPRRVSSVFHKPHEECAKGARAPCQQPSMRVTQRALWLASESETTGVDVTAQCCVDLSGEFSGTKVMVSCKLEGQFSLEWSEASGHFSAGSINLYTLSDTHGNLELESIIRGLTAQHPEVVEKAEDAVRARTHTRTQIRGTPFHPHHTLAGWRQAHPQSSRGQQRAKH